jgi:hypothetical protein
MTQIATCSARGLSLLAGALALTLGGAAQAAPKAAGPGAVVKTFLEDFNKGDVAGAEATHVAEPTIIDEVAPHHWQGAGAFKAWAGDLEKAAQAAGDSDQKVVITGTDRTVVDGDTAYVVVRVLYTYKEHKKRMEEPAHMAVSLRQDAGAWKITGWAWTGTTPHAAAPKAAPASATPAGAPSTPPKT